MKVSVEQIKELILSYSPSADVASLAAQFGLSNQKYRNLRYRVVARIKSGFVRGSDTKRAIYELLKEGKRKEIEVFIGQPYPAASPEDAKGK